MIFGFGVGRSLLKFSVAAGGCVPEGFLGSQKMHHLWVGGTAGCFGLPAEASFLKNVTTGHSWALLVVGRELTLYSREEHANSLLYMGL